MGYRTGLLKTLFDVQSDNFELFFEKQITGMPESARSLLPKDMIERLFNAGFVPNPNKIRKLPFLAKLWVLWRCLRKRVWIFVEQEDGGMSQEEWLELREAVKRKDFGTERAASLDIHGHFCTVNKEFGNCLHYLNSLSLGPAYNYLNKYKNFVHTGGAKFEQQMNYIVRFLRYWEGSKKLWMLKHNLGIHQFLILLYFYDKGETVGSTAYKSTYINAYHGSTNMFKISFRTLQSRGFLVKRGRARGAKMEITASGRELVNSVLTDYAVNC